MEPIMRVVCDEPTGSVSRTVYLASLAPERLRYYWEKLSRFPTVFNHHISEFDDFAAIFISMEGGEPQANGVIWEVDDIGLFFMTDIYPLFQATGHFTFWDQRFRGRERLVREMLKYVFKEFGFRRIQAEVPLYSPPTLAAVERIGFVKEGRLRKYTYYQGMWYDVNLYSVLAEEMLDNGNPEAEGQDKAAEVAGDSTR
jgi:RimJ/RimL family protein N-acetyltransferase